MGARRPREVAGPSYPTGLLLQSHPFLRVAVHLQSSYAGTNGVSHLSN